MISMDVNVLIYAHRQDFAEHAHYAAWLGKLINGDEPFGISELVLSGFIRIATHRKIFKQPTPTAKAIRFVEELISQPHCVRLRPGDRHVAIFLKLCREVNAKGKLVADAYHAALAIEHGCVFVTTDSDFARFPGLRTSHPLTASSF